MWAVFMGLLLCFAWLGQNYTKAEAQSQTSTTRTVTVNASVSPDIELYVSSTSVTLNVTSPGTSGTDKHQIEVRTNCERGYKLYQQRNNELTHTTDGGVTIDGDLDGSVNSPIPYAHNGLGFSLNGDPVEGVWDDGSNFSTFYASAEEANCYASYCSANTVINVIYQLDVKTTQQSGSYQNKIDWYAVSNDI